jgi:glycosyltransferase involved in cell wall biosynthesis
MSRSLAVVIPFYKLSFLEELLQSLAQQTCLDFSVYIGDDCSPADPREVIGRYRDRLDIDYVRFEQRLGGTSLTRQWNRCVGLCKGESWIWVLPDDDLPSTNAVEVYYTALRSDKDEDINIIRFPVNMIDSTGKPLFESPEVSYLETNRDFYVEHLRGRRGPFTLGENIFRRSRLEDIGGFIDFPRAWGSDHATVIAAASGGLIKTTSDAKFAFRLSDTNITNQTDDGPEKLEGRIAFLKWMRENQELFDGDIDEDFYRQLNSRAEYFVLNVWDWSVMTLFRMYQLQILTRRSFNPLPLLKIAALKAGLRKTRDS